MKVFISWSGDYSKRQSPARFILNIPDEPPPGGGSVEKSKKMIHNNSGGHTIGPRQYVVVSPVVAPLPEA